jgi:uncharacterized protein (TIGR02246 family)
MKITRLAIGIGCAAAITATTATAHAVPEQTANAGHRPSCAADIDAIRALAERRVPAAWKANDADAFAAQYTQDASFVVPGPENGVFLKRRDQIRNYMAKLFAGPIKGSTVTAKVINARCVSRDVAVLNTTGGMIMPGEAEPPPERIGVQTWTVVNRHGQWLATAYENARNVDLNPPY